MIVDEDFDPAGMIIVDPGPASVTAALLIVEKPYGYLVADEYHWDRDRQGLLTDQEHYDKITAKWLGYRWEIDPASGGFDALVRRKGQSVRNAINDIEEGIKSVLNGLYSGKLKINGKNCPHLLQTCAAYEFHPDTGKPIKRNDHLPDCLRYGARRLFPPTTSQFWG